MSEYEYPRSNKLLQLKILMLITGSTSAGEVLSPHIQFSTTAKSEVHEHVCLETFKFMKNVRVQFGCNEVKTFPYTFGLNEKGGINKKEFQKYLVVNIIPLYSNAKDVPGKRVCIKLDGELGQIDAKLVAWSRHWGFYIFPGVSKKWLSHKRQIGHMVLLRLNFDPI